jgi:predicted nucleotidyltransferase
VVELIEEHKEQVAQLCRRFHVRRLDVFGSAAAEHGFDPQRSDLDFLVEFEPMSPPQHGKAYFALLNALQNLFSRPIDLIEIRAVANPYLLESIDKNRRQVYAA